MIVVVGEALIDVVVEPSGERAEAVGGAALNVATTLGRLEAPTWLFTQVGDDQRGARILEHLTNAGVEVVATPTRTGRTPTATATLDDSGNASYAFDLDWTLPAQELPPCDALYVGGLGTVLEPGRDSVLDLVEQAYGREVTLCFDPNIRAPFIESPEQTWRDLESIGERSAIIKLSDLDIDLLHPGADPADVARSLLGGEATELVVLTRGGEDAWAFTTGCEVSVPSAQVEVVDTVGAGDAFTGGLLTALYERDALSPHGSGIPADPSGLAQVLGAAAQVAAITCTRRGAQPPARPELPSSWPALD